jgi:uncharacterized membrane protein
VIALASLALATLAFVGTHLALSHPLRVRLLSNLGDQGFLALYSAVAVVTLGWMILAWRAVTNSVALWVAPDWAWWVGSGVILLACILLVGSFFRNPAFPHPGARPRAVRDASGVFAVTRHPMNVAFAWWALVHIGLWGSPQFSDRSARTARSSTRSGSRGGRGWGGRRSFRSRLCSPGEPNGAG